MPTPRQGRQCLLLIKRSADAEYRTLAYETEHAMAGSTDVSETDTKFGAIFQNTTPNRSFSIGAVVDSDPAATEVSQLEAMELDDTGEIFQFKRVFVPFAPNGAPDLASQIFYMGGIGSLNSVSDSASVSDVMTWTGTLQVSGFLVRTQESDIPAAPAPN